MQSWRVLLLQDAAPVTQVEEAEGTGEDHECQPEK